MKSSRTTITTNQLPSVLTHGTLVIVEVSLHTHIQLTVDRCSERGESQVMGPLPCLWLSPPSGEMWS